jgi:hypothetical protein
MGNRHLLALLVVAHHHTEIQLGLFQRIYHE